MEQTTSPSADEGNKHRRDVNQANSQFSTGPKSEPGKQVSAQNALKLGFFLYSCELIRGVRNGVACEATGEMRELGRGVKGAMV